MRIIIGLCVVAFLCFESPSMASDKVMVSTLLDEMISFEKATEFPEPYYTCKMVSSYDRRTVSPDKDWWYASGYCSGASRKSDVRL